MRVCGNHLDMQSLINEGEVFLFLFLCTDNFPQLTIKDATMKNG